MNSTICKTFAITLLGVLAITSCQPGSDDPSIAIDENQLQIEAHLEVAGLYLQQGQYRAAEIEGYNALRVQPDNELTRTFLANLYYEVGDLNNAMNFISTIYAANQQNVDAALLLAELEFRSGSSYRAETILGRLQTETDAQLNRKNLVTGNIHAMRGEFAEAQAAFRSILANDPEHIDGLIASSRLSVSLRDTAQAQAFIDRAVALDPQNLDLLIWQGQFAMLRSEMAQAEEFLFEALDLMADFDTMTSNRFMVLQNIQTVLIAQGRNNEALTYAELIQASPQGQYITELARAVDLYEQGDYEEAEAAILGLLNINPNDITGNVLLGLTQYAQQDYVAAGEVLTELVNSDSASPQVVRTLASVQLRQGRPRQAIAMLEDAIEEYPNDSALYAILGISYQGIGEYEQSLVALQEALNLRPDDSRTLYAIAQTYFLQEDYAQAIENMSASIDANPEFLGAKTSLVGIYLVQENFTQARAQVQQWLDEQPTSPAYTVLAGWIAFAEENLDEARRLFESTLQVDPTNTQALLFLARIHILNEEYTQARTRYELIVESDPDNIEALSGLLAVSTADGETAQSAARVDQIAQENPDNYVAPLMLSQFYLSQDNFDEALRYAEMALSREPNNATRSNLATNYAAQAGSANRGDLQRAIADILDNNEATETETIRSLAQMSMSAVTQGNVENALTIIDTLKSRFPNSALGYEAEGDVLFETGDQAGSLSAYRQAWEIEQSSRLGSKIHFGLNSSGRRGDARQFLDEWMASTPDDGAANLLMGIDFLSQANEERATSYLEKAYEQQPTNLIVLNNLAWVYRESNIGRALELAEQAIELDPEYADALDTFGWLLHLNGESDRAIQYLQRAVDLSPDSEVIAQHLQEARG